MKAERWICGLWAWVLSFCAAFGAVGGMASGLWLEENVPLLAVILAAAALLAAVCCVFRLYLLPLGGLLAVCLMFWKRLLASARYLVIEVSEIYDLAYHWGVIQWPEGAPETNSAMWILAVLGCCVICLVVTAVLSGRGLKAGALVTLVPLIPCVFVIDTVPETGYLFLTLLSMVLLLLSDNVRSRSLRKGNALLLGLALPVLLGLGLLFAWMPRETYDGQAGAQKLEDFVVSVLEGQEFWGELPKMDVPAQEDRKPQLDLADVGYNPQLGLQVMSVKAETAGVLYLRGSAYDVYTGTGWKASGTEVSENAYSVGQGQTRYVTIHTARVHSVLYFPYVTEQLSARIVEGQLPNSEKLRQYTIAYREPAGYEEAPWNPAYVLPGDFMDTFLQLPQATRSWAEEYLPSEIWERFEGGQIREAALQIGELVKKSASYDRMTTAMPRGETDFARWFLYESNTGYCTHFATAATVLLRAAGIPARYVTGYLAHTQADQFAQVTTDEAHAWVEYYVHGLGWVVLEATPVDLQSPVRPVETQPGETIPSTTVPSSIETAPPTTQTQDTPQTQAPSENPATTGNTKPGSSGPGLTDPTGGETPQKPRQLPQWVKHVGMGSLMALAAVAVILGQWRLRLWLRQRKRRKGRANTRLLTRWREAEQICRLLKQNPPDSLHLLALKARFSQHTVSARELQDFDLELDSLRNVLRTKRWHWQLVYRLIFALY